MALKTAKDSMIDHLRRIDAASHKLWTLWLTNGCRLDRANLAWMDAQLDGIDQSLTELAERMERRVKL